MSTIPRETMRVFSIALFIAFVVATLYLCFLLVRPFIEPLLWAMILAVLCHPLQRWLAKKLKRPTWAALLVCGLVVIILIGPITWLMILLLEEASHLFDLVQKLQAEGYFTKLFEQQVPFMIDLKARLAPYVDIEKIDIAEPVQQAIKTVSQFILTRAASLVIDFTITIFQTLTMLFALFFLLVDGPALVQKIVSLLPLPRAVGEKIMISLQGMIAATIQGGVVIAAIQGTIGGILFAAVGIPSAVFWGTLMAFLSLLPFVGAFVVFVPAGIALLLMGETVKGLIVLGVGVGVISQIDNFLRPYMLSGQTSLHPLLLFLAIGGGVISFGMIGIILGPMIVAVAMTVLEAIGGGNEVAAGS